MKQRLKPWQARLRELKPQLSNHVLDALVGALEMSKNPGRHAYLALRLGFCMPSVAGMLIRRFAPPLRSIYALAVTIDRSESPTGTLIRRIAVRVGLLLVSLKPWQARLSGASRLIFDATISVPGVSETLAGTLIRRFGVRLACYHYCP